MKSYLVLICSAILVGAFCVVLAAPGGNINDEPQPEPEQEPALVFPAYSVKPSRVLNVLPYLEDDSVSNSESDSDSWSSSSSESSWEEDGDGKPEGRTLFLILRLLQLLSRQNSTTSG